MTLVTLARPRALLAALVCVSPAAASPPSGLDDDVSSVVINEIMYNPSDSLGADDDYQWVELYNTSALAVDLQGWSLNDAALSGTIGAHDYAIVARQDLSDPDQDGAYFSAFYNPQHDYQIEHPIIDLEGVDLGLGDSDFDLVLRDAEGTAIDSTGFHPAPGGDGDGSTLERLVAPFVGDVANFEPSAPPERFGSPEGQNSVSPVVIDVLLPDGPFEPGELVLISETILNRTSQPQPISLMRALELPEDLVLPIDVPELPDWVVLPPDFELTLEAEVEVPELLPEGGYAYQAAFGRGIQSAGSEWEEFIVRTNDQSSERRRVHNFVNSCAASPRAIPAD